MLLTMGTQPHSEQAGQGQPGLYLWGGAALGWQSWSRACMVALGDAVEGIPDFGSISYTRVYQQWHV